MIEINAHKVVDNGLAGFERGIDITDGQLQLDMTTPEYMTSGDALGGLTEEKSTQGDHLLNIAYHDLAKPETAWIFGRVLLIDALGIGSLPLVIMPDPKRQSGVVRFVQFNQPYNPESGLDEGQLLALSFETTTKENAGFGGHSVESPFEGGHFSVATVASRLAERGTTVKSKGHAGAHQILDDSVATDLRKAGLTSISDEGYIPLPIYKDVNVLKMPSSARFIAKWHDKMIDSDGKPIVAAHPEAAKVLLGTVIENLGPQGIDTVGNFISDVRR